jgi:hypothetical protein
LRAFDRLLSVSTEDIEFELRGFTCIPWADFVLNPRRLGGSDFLELRISEENLDLAWRPPYTGAA